VSSHYFVGWGVGPWNCDDAKKRDALVVLSGDGDRVEVCGMPVRTNVRPVLSEHRREELIRRLLSVCSVGLTNGLRVTLAVDAPLGWPTAVFDLLHTRRTPAIPVDVDANPMLFRATERALLARGFRPLSAVRDMIGSQSTKAMYFLKRVGFSPIAAGVFRVASPRTASVYDVIETSPSCAKRSESVAEEHARLVDDPRVQAAVDDDPRARADLHNALYAAIIAHHFVRRRDTLAPPDVEIAMDEGWIWIPADAEPRAAGRQK
jgi:hypothetical protein